MEVCEYVYFVVLVGAFFALDKGFENGLKVAGVSFLSVFIGMFGVLVILMVMEKFVGEDVVNKLKSMVSLVLNWITSWLSVFYVSSLVVTSLVLMKIVLSVIVKVLVIVVVGFVSMIVFSVMSVNVICGMIGMIFLSVAFAKAASSTEDYVYKMWGGILVVFIVVVFVMGVNLVKVVIMFVVMVCLFFVGNSFDVKVKMNLIVTISVLVNVYAVAFGFVMGDGWMGMFGFYCIGVLFGLNNIVGFGVGDILMIFLGSVILSFAFKVFEARKIIV